MSLTLFLSVIARRLRALGRRREPRRYSDIPRRLRLASSTAMRIVFVGGRPVIRFVDTERKERVRLSTLREVSFSVVNGKPVFRFLGEDYTKQKRPNEKQHYKDIDGRVRLTSTSSMKLYQVSGASHVAIIN